jgi:hypothetical protein
MLLALLFLLSMLGVLLGALAFALSLAIAVGECLLTSVERSLAGFTNGHVIVGVLYAVPAGLFLYMICEWLYLAISFGQAVL